MRSVAHPSYFGSPQTPCFGHLHVPSDGQARGWPVVLCPTYGHEYMSAHRSMRVLAEQLAEAGQACLRFDPPGWGDSADVPPESLTQGLAAWPGGIAQAIDHAKAITGAKGVVLVSLRLGATITALAAQGRPDVVGLVAIGPVLKGRAFARECKALGMATLARTGLASTAAVDTIEAGGFVLSASDVAFLSSIDLMTLSTLPAPRVLIIDRDHMPPDATWHDRLSALGAEVERSQPPGYEAMMQVPHFSQVPLAMLDHITQWVCTLPSPEQHLALPNLAAHAEMALHRLGVREQAFWLSSASPMSAVLSEPLAARGAHASAARVGVIMLNTGGEHRVGTNRMYTRWARRWAAQGWVALRLDMPGLGNSPAGAGQADNEIHLRHATQDIRCAIAHLKTQHGVQDVHVIGLCSGAFHALSAAFEGADLRSVTAINQMVYFWQDKMPLAGEASAAVVVAIAKNVGRSLTDPARWLKLLRGEVHVQLILRALWRRLQQRLNLRLRSLARLMRWPLQHDLHTAFMNTAAHGTDVRLVFTTGEPGLTILQEQAGQAVARLVRQGRLSLTLMPHTDHTFTQAHAQERLFGAVDAGIRLSAPAAPTRHTQPAALIQEITP